MSEAFQYLDILILAVIAALVLLRLRSVLGRRTGHERQTLLALPMRNLKRIRKKQLSKYSQLRIKNQKKMDGLIKKTF